MPTEYLLVALSSCFAMALAHVARKRDVALGPLTVKAVGTYDGPSFSAIDLEVVFEEDPPRGIDDPRRAGPAGLLRVEHVGPVAAPDGDRGAGVAGGPRSHGPGVELERAGPPRREGGVEHVERVERP